MVQRAAEQHRAAAAAQRRGARRRHPGARARRGARPHPRLSAATTVRAHEAGRRPARDPRLPGLPLAPCAPTRPPRSWCAPAAAWPTRSATTSRCCSSTRRAAPRDAVRRRSCSTTSRRSTPATPAGMLRAVASSGAQVREAALLAAEAGVARLADDGRPRAVVVVGMGGSAIAGDVLAAVAGPTLPVPLVVAPRLRPAGLGRPDRPRRRRVLLRRDGGDASARSRRPSAAAAGCWSSGAAGSPLDDLGQRGRAVFVPVTQGRQPRASVWALATPLRRRRARARPAAGAGRGGRGDGRPARAARRPLPARRRAPRQPGQAARRCTSTAPLPVLWGTLAAVGGRGLPLRLPAQRERPRRRRARRPAGGQPQPGRRARRPDGRPRSTRPAIPTTSSATAATTSSRPGGWRSWSCATPRSTRQTALRADVCARAGPRAVGARCVELRAEGEQPLRPAGLAGRPCPTSPAPTSRCCRAPTRRRWTAIDALKAADRPRAEGPGRTGRGGAHSGVRRRRAASREVPVSYAQCPICALRFRYQSELEAHAHDDHCLPSDVHAAAAPRAARGAEEPQPTSRLLRLP